MAPGAATALPRRRTAPAVRLGLRLGVGRHADDGHGRLLPTVDPQQHAGPAALDFVRLLGGPLAHLVLEPEPSENPGDRRLLGGVVAGPIDAGDDQTLHRAGHRDVVEAESLGLLGALALALHVPVRRRADSRAGRRVGDLEAEPAVGEGKDVRDRGPEAPGVGHDDDLELEALRRVDREQADGVPALLLGHGVGLFRAERLLAFDEADEALEIGSAELFVGAREACELAEVRVAPRAVVPRQHGKVVVVLREDPLAEKLQRRVRRELEEPVVPLPEGEQEPPVLLGQVARQRLARSPRKIGCRDASARISTSASFETPTKGDASTVSSASSS